MRVVAAPRSSSLTPSRVAALALAVCLILGLNRARGATACPHSAPVVPCATAATAAAKAPAVAAVTVAAGPAADAPAWKSTLDPLSAGGWVLITDGPVDNPSVVYASTHNVLHNGNVVTAWVRWEYSRIQAEIYPLHYQSAVTHEELDCDARAYRRAAVFYFRRNNLQDKALQFTALNDDTTWKLAIPGTEGDAMLNWACATPARRAADGKPSARPGSAAAAPPAGGGIDLHTTR